MSTKSPPPPSRNKTKSPVRDTLKPQQQSALIRLKTVVRRLPPNLPESVFWQSVQPWVSDDTVAWKVFYQGKMRKKLNKENIPSRAYLLFKNEDSLAVFSREYDGHIFRDKQGIESQAVVEFAPNQKTPPEKKKVDSRHATIQQDEDYLSFVSSLQKPEKPAEIDIDALLASTVPPEEPKITPLLAALKQAAQEKKNQEKKTILQEPTKAQSKKGGTKQDPTDSSSKNPASGPSGKNGVPPGKGSAAVPAGKNSGPAGKSGPPAKNALSSKNGLDTAKGDSKKGGTKQESLDPVALSGKNNQLGGKKGKKGKVANSSSAPPAASSASTSTATPPSASSSAAPGASTSATNVPTETRRSRAVLGLQSRQLKAALSGAGVQVAPPSSAHTLTNPHPNLPAAPSNPPTISGSSDISQAPPRLSRRERRLLLEQNNDVNDPANPGRNSGNGRGPKDKDKDKIRTRNASGPPMNITPRILTRQEAPPSGAVAKQDPVPVIMQRQDPTPMRLRPRVTQDQPLPQPVLGESSPQDILRSGLLDATGSRSGQRGRG